MIHVYHFSMQKLHETTYQSKKHTFLKYVTGAFWWCNLKKAQLISCFVNDYCIPTTLFKTISKLKIVFSICTQTELCKLWSCFFQAAPFKQKGVVQSPVLYLCLFLCVSLSVCIVVNFPLIHKLCTYALRIFHSILIHMYMH